MPLRPCGFHDFPFEPLGRPGNDKASYASPVQASLAGRQVILSVNAASPARLKSR